jgi:integrase/recombinase XerD
LNRRPAHYESENPKGKALIFNGLLCDVLRGLLICLAFGGNGGNIWPVPGLKNEQDAPFPGIVALKLPELPEPMARPTRFEPVACPNGWRLNVPAKYTESGRRERHFFKLLKDAQAAAKKLRKDAAEHGHKSQAIRPGLAEDATAAAALLEPYGVTLTAAAAFYRAAKETETASVPTSEALKQWLIDVEAKVRGRTLTNYKQTSKRFEALGKKPLASVTRADLQAIIAPPGMAATTAAGHFRVGLAFWNWCTRRGWCTAEPFEKLDRPAKGARKKIEFLTPEDSAALLAAAVEYYPQAVPMFAVGLFAGVRPVELTRLDPDLVAADGIDVGADESKGESRRHIVPCETLALWLERHPFQTVSNWDRVWDACRRLAGWDVASEFADKMLADGKLDKLPPPTRGPWPQDGMRHSCATYHVAVGVDLGGMAFWFGHTGGETTLRRFYVGKAKRKEALEFFAIVPAGTAAPATIQPVESVA